MSAKALDHVATRNACKLCTPLGAALVLKGIAGAVPLLHGSQGCSTYIRRYLISHFKEPIDIASSNFGEDAVIFGGRQNLHAALDNLRRQYAPELIGIATTCLSETIGDDVRLYLHEYRQQHARDKLPALVHVATPSYRGTHIDGFHATVKAVVDAVALRAEGVTGERINLFPGMLSPEDLRYLREIFTDFGVEPLMLPDYSETLDGGLWDQYHRVPAGGASLRDITRMGAAKASIEFGRILATSESAGKTLQQRFDVPVYQIGLPIGIYETDALMYTLEQLTGRTMPDKYRAERERLIDAYADGHKYVSHARVAAYGEEDLVIGLASFLHEIGATPVICASGGKSGYLKVMLGELFPEFVEPDPSNEDAISIVDDVDFLEIDELVEVRQPDLLIGHSKGYALARQRNLPLVRVGFPIHDRFGGGRVLHVGYRGALQLFDRIVNTIIEQRQTASGYGYAYM